ncbi:Protein Atp6V1Fnb [Manis pentadactyla]|nr:Protein Atp6V1Fnb [Manis pentadactyla]
MRQVPPCPLQLPFRGISHDSLGCVTYLREQHRQEPEKFLYPVLSSWEYSRHVGDIVKDAGAPAHARSQPIAKSFYIKSSIFHFPRRTDQLM